MDTGPRLSPFATISLQGGTNIDEPIWNC